METRQIPTYGTRFSITEKDIEIARATLYIMTNDLHQEPFGFIENVFVQPNYQGQGYGTQIIQAVIEQARESGCYKLICISRYKKDKVHKWYKRLGFEDHGLEFRINL